MKGLQALVFMTDLGLKLQGVAIVSWYESLFNLCLQFCPQSLSFFKGLNHRHVMHCLQLDG